MIEATSCGGVVIFRGKILLLYKNYKNRYEGWVLLSNPDTHYRRAPESASHWKTSADDKPHETYNNPNLQNILLGMVSIYFISLASNERNLFDIFHAAHLKQPGFYGQNPFIVGAGSKATAPKELPE